MTPPNGGQSQGGANDEYTGLAVAVGRIEEGIKGVNSKLDQQALTSASHAETLSRHEVSIELLKSRMPKKTPWYNIVGAVFGILGAVAVATGTIIALVRLGTP